VAFKFQKIMECVVRQLDQIIMEEDDEDRGVITSKDFMNDFATNEFIEKNMRVRPQSGVTRGGDNDETRTQAAGDQGFSRMGEGGENDWEKDDAEAKYALDKDRKDAKDRFHEFQRRKQQEEEMLKKAKR
jgi:rubrerythrin